MCIGWWFYGKGSVTLLFDHMTSRDFMIKVTCDLVSGSPYI